MCQLTNTNPGLLWVTPGINADHFRVVDSRVCATPKYETSISPTSDNFNLGTRSTEGTDTYSVFPETGIQPNPLQGTCQASGHGH